jgi:hypothetical protein
MEILTTNSEQERDLRRHSHIGTFHRGFSNNKHSHLTKNFLFFVHRYRSQ